MSQIGVTFNLIQWWSTFQLPEEGGCCLDCIHNSPCCFHVPWSHAGRFSGTGPALSSRFPSSNAVPYLQRYENRANGAHKQAWRRILSAPMWKYSPTQSFIGAFRDTSAGKSDRLYQAWPLKNVWNKNYVLF